MGRDTIKSLNEIVVNLQMAIEVHDYSKINSLLRELQEHITAYPNSVTIELLETLEQFENKLKKEKEKVVAKMSDLQKLKKYRS